MYWRNTGASTGKDFAKMCGQDIVCVMSEIRMKLSESV
jgi:hypothetical protein